MWGFILFGAFMVSFVLNACVIWISKRFKLFIDQGNTDKPQRFHTNPTPRSGGLGIFAPFALMLLFQIHLNPSLYLGLLLGGGVIFLSGIIEDFNASLSPKMRLVLQCLGGGIFMACSGIYLQDLGFGITLPSYIGIPFSLFAIVGIINAINIIDGFNGLASGVVLMALCGILSVLGGNFEIQLVVLTLIGSVLGFFILNFPWGKIFLGDGGAYFLGFTLASLLIVITQSHQNIGGGGYKSLSLVWDRTFNLSILGGDLFYFQTTQKTLTTPSRQSPPSSMPISQTTLFSKDFQSSYKSDFAWLSPAFCDSLLSTFTIPNRTSASFNQLHSALSPSLSQTRLKQISPWFGIALLIYPFWEVLFSIYRKKFVRHLSPMQPDGVHLHMLFYKRYFKNNPKTTLAILALIAPFMILSCIFANHSWILLGISLSFVLLYLRIYSCFIHFQSFFSLGRKRKKIV